MSKKQTAVEWLSDKLVEILGDKCNELTQEQTLANHYAIKQALQLEREQIEEACVNVVEDILNFMDTGKEVNTQEIFNNYYTQTYGECTQQ